MIGCPSATWVLSRIDGVRSVAEYTAAVAQAICLIQPFSSHQNRFFHPTLGKKGEGDIPPKCSRQHQFFVSHAGPDLPTATPGPGPHKEPWRKSCPVKLPGTVGNQNTTKKKEKRKKRGNPRAQRPGKGGEKNAATSQEESACCITAQAQGFHPAIFAPFARAADMLCFCGADLSSRSCDPRLFAGCC